MIVIYYANKFADWPLMCLHMLHVFLCNENQWIVPGTVELD
jgi:hypothetical protein